MTRRAHRHRWVLGGLATSTALAGAQHLSSPTWLIAAVLAGMLVELGLAITAAAVTATVRLRASRQITSSADAVRVLEIEDA